MILRNLVFLPHLSIYRQEVFFTHSTNQIPNNVDGSYAQRSSCLRRKAIIMATWSHHVIALVITSNDILLSLPITLIYYLFLPDYIPNIPNLIYLLLETGFPSLHCWNAPARYCIVEKHISLSSFCSFNSYSPTFHLLGLDLSLSGFVGIRITSQSFAIDKGLQSRTSLGWCLRWKDVTPLQNVSTVP